MVKNVSSQGIWAKIVFYLNSISAESEASKMDNQWQSVNVIV